MDRRSGRHDATGHAGSKALGRQHAGAQRRKAVRANTPRTTPHPWLPQPQAARRPAAPHLLLLRRLLRRRGRRRGGCCGDRRRPRGRRCHRRRCGLLLHGRVVLRGEACGNALELRHLRWGGGSSRLPRAVFQCLCGVGGGSLAAADSIGAGAPRRFALCARSRVRPGMDRAPFTPTHPPTHPHPPTPAPPLGSHQPAPPAAAPLQEQGQEHDGGALSPQIMRPVSVQLRNPSAGAGQGGRWGLGSRAGPRQCDAPSQACRACRPCPGPGRRQAAPSSEMRFLAILSSSSARIRPLLISMMFSCASCGVGKCGRSCEVPHCAPSACSAAGRVRLGARWRLPRRSLLRRAGAGRPRAAGPAGPRPSDAAASCAAGRPGRPCAPRG